METIADSYHLEAYLVAALMIGIFVMIFSNRLYYYREKEISRNANQLNTQLGLVFDSTKTQVWTYDIFKNIYNTYLEHGTAKKEYTTMDFGQTFYNLDDFSEFRSQVLFKIRDGEKERGSMLIRGISDEKEKTANLYEVTLSVLERDKKGKPRLLLGIQRDITEETKKQEESRKLSLRFQTVFNSSLTDMIFYDSNGILTEANEKALETFQITDYQDLLRRKVKFTDIPSYRNINLEDFEGASLSSFTDIDTIKKQDERVPELKLGGKFYYEVTLNAVRDESHKLRGIIAAGRNITEMVESHHRQQKDNQLLKETTKNIQNYIEDINYTLRTSGVRLINYYPDAHELVIFSDLDKAQYRLSQIRCASLIDDSDRRRVRGLFLRMDRKHQGNIAETFRTRFIDEQGRNIYLAFSLVPVTGKDGEVTHYFGMFRNETEIVYTEAKLLEETKKAQETEELKDTFLTNMSHEIRTPLNAVLGFADLFRSPHDEADEPVFAEEIKRNTGELLALVNDILFISRLDANMVEFNYKECDFATLFEGFCYMGWSMVAPGVSVSVENPYSHLMITIDEQNLGEVIQKLCLGASYNTTKGHIKAKCEYRHGELNITIEDTGKGFSPEVQEHIFDRFVKNELNSQYGTGLEMPIIKELITKMGGSIEIQSEKEIGNTVYVIIPCEMSSMEKKPDITI